jgi:hypothetical protein
MHMHAFVSVLSEAGLSIHHFISLPITPRNEVHSTNMPMSFWSRNLDSSLELYTTMDFWYPELWATHDAYQQATARGLALSEAGACEAGRDWRHGNLATHPSNIIPPSQLHLTASIPRASWCSSLALRYAQLLPALARFRFRCYRHSRTRHRLVILVEASPWSTLPNCRSSSAGTGS